MHDIGSFLVGKFHQLNKSLALMYEEKAFAELCQEMRFWVTGATENKTMPANRAELVYIQIDPRPGACPGKNIKFQKISNSTPNKLTEQ